LTGIEGEAARVEYLLDNLTGIAKDEVRVRDVYNRDTGSKILEIIKECFEGEETTGQLHQRFYQREQKETESLQEYSLVLMKLMDQMVRKDGRMMGDKDLVLTERFVDGVRDRHLKREWRKFAQENAGMPFVDFRRSVLSWSVGGIRETGSPSINVKLEAAQTNKIHAPNMGGDRGASQGGVDSTMESVLQMLQAQQRVLEQQQRQLNSWDVKRREIGQQEQSRGNGSYRGQMGGVKRNLTCFRCHGRGHVTSECPSEGENDGDITGGVTRGVSGAARTLGRSYMGIGRGEYERTGSPGYGSQGYSGHGSQGYSGHGSQGYSGYGSQGYSGHGSQGYSGPGSQGYSGHGSQGYSGYGSQGYSGHGSRGRSGYGSRGRFGHRGMGHPGGESQGHGWQGSSEHPGYGSSGYTENNYQGASGGTSCGGRPGVGANVQQPLSGQAPAS
jgi:hypothetical protein